MIRILLLLLTLSILLSSQLLGLNANANPCLDSFERKAHVQQVSRIEYSDDVAWILFRDFVVAKVDRTGKPRQYLSSKKGAGDIFRYFNKLKIGEDTIIDILQNFVSVADRAGIPKESGVSVQDLLKFGKALKVGSNSDEAPSVAWADYSFQVINFYQSVYPNHKPQVTRSNPDSPSLVWKALNLIQTNRGLKEDIGPIGNLLVLRKTITDMKLTESAELMLEIVQEQYLRKRPIKELEVRAQSFSKSRKYSEEEIRSILLD